MAMTTQQKLDFVHKQTKIALEHVQHFDAGGSVAGGYVSQAPTIAGTPNATNPNTSGIAGAVGDVLGTNNNFQASGANITPGTSLGQINAAYTGVQGAMGQQQGIANTLTPGVTQGANAQANLSNQLANESVGGGPNPAQAALNQNTAANVANQGALMASQRGAGSNVGLIARQAAQQGAGIQQQAVGQEATQEAQQQLNAQNALANLSGTQVNQGANATQTVNQEQQNEQNILQGANTAENNANVSMQENINNVNAATSAANQNSNQNVLSTVGNAINGQGSLISSIFAEGGVVPGHIRDMAKIYHKGKYADGGEVWQNDTPVQSSISSSAPSLPAYNGDFGKASSSGGGGGGGGGGMGGMAAIAAMAKGGKVPNMGSRLEKGGKVPGKAKVAHDDYSNDTVSAKLSPGEVVIDLNTLKDPGKLGQMARFVAQNIERKKMGRKLV